MATSSARALWVWPVPPARPSTLRRRASQCSHAIERDTILRGLQRLVIGEIQDERRDRHQAVAHRPAIGAFLELLDATDAQPEMRAAVRILDRRHAAVVVRRG